MEGLLHRITILITITFGETRIRFIGHTMCPDCQQYWNLIWLESATDFGRFPNWFPSRKTSNKLEWRLISFDRFKAERRVVYKSILGPSCVADDFTSSSHERAVSRRQSKSSSRSGKLPSFSGCVDLIKCPLSTLILQLRPIVWITILVNYSDNINGWYMTK